MKGIDLRPLKGWLDKGDIEAVSKEVGLKTPQQASNIMAGRSANFLFAEKIHARAQKNKALKKQIESI